MSREVKTVAVIGPMADDKNSLTCRYGSQHPHVVTGLQGIKDYLGDNATILYAKGCNVRDKNFPKSDVMYFPMTGKEEQGIDEAVSIARKADVAILFVGDDGGIVGESRTRVSLDLAGRQKELVRAVQAAGTPVVMVMFNGRAATINWETENIPAIVEAWYPGEFSGRVVAEALWGEFCPGGKLPVTFPKSVGQIPWAFPFKPHAAGKGFARIDGSLFPFGFGLSYTTFEIAGLQVVTPEIKDGGVVKVACKVKNTGKVKGDEVVQLYLRDDVSKTSRFEKELCGFERVTLEPGEEKTVSFEINRRSYGYYNYDSKFVVEPGTFTLYAGNSSENTPLTGTFEIK